MALGDLSYEEVKVGGQPGYEFSREGRNPVRLFGDAAERLKSRIDAAKATGPQPTADASDVMSGGGDAGMSVMPETATDAGGSGGAIPDYPSQMSTDAAIAEAAGPRNVLQSELGDPNIRTANIRGPEDMGTGRTAEIRGPEDMGSLELAKGGERHGASGSWGEPQPAAAQQPSAPGSPGQLVKLPGNAGYAQVGPNGELLEVKRYAGSPSVSQGQLQKTAKQKVEMPVGITTQTQGGYDQNPEFLEGFSEAQINKKLAAQKALDTAMEAAGKEQEAARADLLAKSTRVAQQQAYEQESRDLMAQQEKRHVEALTEYRTAKVDPKRLFRGPEGTMRAIGAAIASGFGQFGAALTGTPNNAMRAIEAAIDRDIDAQKQAIISKKQTEQSELSQLMRRGMDMKQAEATLRAAQYEHAAANARWLKSQAQPGQLQADFDALLANMDEKAMQFNEQYRLASEAKVTQTMQSRYAYPQKGSPGGMRRTGAVIMEEQKGGEAPEQKTVAQGTVDSITEHAKSWKSFNNLSKNPLLGEGEGNFLDVTGGPGRILTGKLPASLGGRDAQDFDQDLATGLQANRKAVTGAGASPDELSRLRSDWLGQGSQREIKRRAEENKQTAVQGIKTTMAGLPPEERNRVFQTLDPELQAEVLK